jgi:hypothetical protein
MSRRPGWLAALHLALVAGCASPPPLQHPAVTTAMMRRFDLDGSGMIEAGEWSALALPGVEPGPWDADGDGEISPAELERGLLLVDPRKDREVQLRALEQGLVTDPLVIDGQRIGGAGPRGPGPGPGPRVRRAPGRGPPPGPGGGAAP